MKKWLGLLLTAISTFCFAQTKNGKATALGQCSVSHSGNGDTITITNCGIGREQGNKIVSLLKQVLLNRDSTAVNEKLDELLKTAAKPTAIYQSSTGPNSPNIAGSGNQVTYTDTSELPILSQKKIDGITAALASSKFKIVAKWSSEDREAAILGDDLLAAAKAAGWDTDFNVGVGSHSMQLVPILVAVRTADLAKTSGATSALVAIREATGVQAPGIIDEHTPDNEVDVFLSSHPVKRPK